MEVLEIKPLNSKKVKIYLVRNENWSLDIHNKKLLKNILEKEKFRFAIIDFNTNISKKSYEQPLSKFLSNHMIPYYHVDIPDHVKDYLDMEIFDKEVQIHELDEEYEKILLNSNEKDTFKAESLKNWIEMLKQELISKKIYLRASIRPKWIVKKVLDIANVIKMDMFSIIHFTHEEIISELKSLFENYNIKVIKYDISKKHLKKF